MRKLKSTLFQKRVHIQSRLCGDAQSLEQVVDRVFVNFHDGNVTESVKDAKASKSVKVRHFLVKRLPIVNPVGNFGPY